MKTSVLATLAGALMLAGVLLLLWPEGDSHPPVAGPSSSHGGMSPSAGTPLPEESQSSSSDHLAHDQDHDHDSAELRPQLRVVRAFAKAFIADKDQQRWIAGLQPYVTPELLDGFTYTDPHLRLTGKVDQVIHLEPGDLFQINLSDGQTLTCTVTAAADGGWIVDSVQPVETPMPNGTDV